MYPGYCTLPKHLLELALQVPLAALTGPIQFSKRRPQPTRPSSNRILPIQLIQRLNRLNRTVKLHQFVTLLQPAGVSQHIQQ